MICAVKYSNNGYCLFKQIKLVNINSTDIVDGRPSIVLGLVWTIVLYFQVSLLQIIYIVD